MVFSGRTIYSKDIEMIKWAKKTYPGLSRSELARTVCDLIAWTTPTGRAKLQQCLRLFKALEDQGILELSALDPQHRRKSAIKKSVTDFKKVEITGDVGSIQTLRLEIASPGEALGRWRAYMDQYHIPGNKLAFGPRLHYFVKSGGTELGCMQFSTSSSALEERDKWIGWTPEKRKARLHLIVNNSRFLIFPWVHVKNLASKALSTASKQIREDWLQEFGYEPVLLETFVDLKHFKGTCYRAANWTYLGDTTGRGRMNRDRKKTLSRKAIFMYPLEDDFRGVLRGEKSCKAADLDE